MRPIHLLLALLAGGMLAAAAPVPPQAKPAASPQARDWRATVVRTPAGAYVIGNPAAKVKLIEYLSYTCPHCAHFVAQSKAPLKDDLVRRGVVRVEVRHAVRDPLDMAAALLARCAGPRGFAGASEAIFAAQQQWYQQGAAWWQANAAQLQSLSEPARLKAAARASGLIQLMRGRGMTPATIDRCFATPADVNQLAAMADAAWAAIDGTPAFVINGKPGGGGTWETLEPELRAAGAQ
ncbi:thioredoxin domain-containing protein [Sphingomonas sp.]|uniref:DsbA family protein n=1 Tax=Sphingomonas sp. TaxID=28214 RepID=UPI001EB38D81|nr:thioredoxin domain-containing protein [Sphingomonas sp.]MBX3593679.1 thioredoxin domain-containing protein [Sphingomonas sp.]